MSSLANGFSRARTIPTYILRQLATEPLASGALLYFLTRASPHVRERVLGPLRPYILSKNADARIATAVRILKVLLAIGVGGRISQLLDRLALNNWYLRRPGAAWRFGDAQKSELVLITGGCSGFGLEMAKRFSEHARVIVLDVGALPDELARLNDVHYYKCDITDFDALQSLAAEIKSTHGNPSVLINNAGIAQSGPSPVLHDLQPHAVDRLFKVNLVSHFVLIREFLPGMLAARKGHVVSIASMASYVSAPGLLDYACSKVGALYLNDGLRAELLTRHGTAGHSIHTTSVHPSWHATGIVKPFESRLRELGVRMDPPSNVANEVVRRVLARRSGQIFMPASESRWANLRAYPVWVQDWAFGWAWGRWNA